MTEKKTKQPLQPVALHKTGERIRVCGKWQKKGYKPDDAEIAAWRDRCKARGWDPKTGKPKVDTTKKQ